MAVQGANYREDFRQRGNVTLLSTEAYDARRMASWAPYVVVPFAFFVTNRVPKAYRVRAWTGCLVTFGLCSCIMYNTDTSSDGGPPELIRVR